MEAEQESLQLESQRPVVELLELLLSLWVS